MQFWPYKCLSGCSFNEVADGKEFDNELELLLTEIIKKKKDIFKKAAEAAGFSFVQKITLARTSSGSKMCG